LVIALLLAGCARKPVAYQRWAVLPFENLSPDPAMAWMSRGLAEAVCLHLAGSPQVDVSAVGSLREAPTLRATHVLHGYVVRTGAQVRVEAVLEAAAGGGMAARAAATGDSPLRLARLVAGELHGQVRDFGATRDEALRAYVEGLEAREASAAVDAFQRAAKLEPGFGAAYLAWAQRLAGAGDPRGARQIIAQAAREGSRIPGVERARLAVMLATLEGDRSAQERALMSLAQVTPADSDVFRRLGDQAMALRRHAVAADAYLKAADRDPGNALLFNQLGYAQGYARDLADAVRSLERYRQMRPEEANPLDSLGDVHYYLGQFTEAEKYYLEAWRKDAGFLGGGEPYKAAWARLMQGNRAGADDLFGKYIQVRRAAGDPLAEFARAEWEYLTGRRREAVDLLEQLGKERGSVAAWVQLSVWSLEAGDRQRAREYAARAAAAARDPGSALMARLGQYLAGPEASAADWASAAQRAFPEAAQGMIRRTALAYALLLSGHCPAALPLLQELHNEIPASEGEPLNVLVAWALIETGRTGEVGDLLDTYPVRRPGAEQPFSILSFPRLFRLRGILLEKQGRQAEAQAAYRFFEALRGATRS